MQGLNLFGVQIDQRATEEAFNRDTKRQKKEVERVLNDLVSLAQQVDPQFESADFSKKKTFNFYDPYTEQDSQFASLRFEDEMRLRASIVVDVHKDNIKDLDDKKDLSYAD